MNSVEIKMLLQKRYDSILQLCLVLNLSFAATVSGRPMCFSLLSTAEKIKGKKCVEITRLKAALTFFTTFLLHHSKNFTFDSYNSNWVFFHIGFLYFHPHMYLCFCLFFHMFFSLLQFSLYLHNSTW